MHCAAGGTRVRELHELVSGKLSKSSVNYGPGSAQRKCELCTMFRSPASCTLVAGMIDRSDVCDRFERKASGR